MSITQLAEFIAKTCPEVQGIARTAEQLIQDRRATAALLSRIESKDAIGRINAVIAEELQHG